MSRSGSGGASKSTKPDNGSRTFSRSGGNGSNLANAIMDGARDKYMSRNKGLDANFYFKGNQSQALFRAVRNFRNRYNIDGDRFPIDRKSCIMCHKSPRNQTLYSWRFNGEQAYICYDCDRKLDRYISTQGKKNGIFRSEKNKRELYTGEYKSRLDVHGIDMRTRKPRS